MNQNPEQIARDNIDRMLQAAGWAVQDVSKFNPSASLGVAVKEYPTDTGPADYILLVERQPPGGGGANAGARADRGGTG